MPQTFIVEALEKFTVRTFYFIEAETPEDAEQQARNGHPYTSHTIEEGGEEWLETVSVEEHGNA